MHGRDAYKKTKAASEEHTKRRDDAAQQLIDGTIYPKIEAAIAAGKFEIEVMVDNELSGNVRKLLNENGYRVCDKPSHTGVSIGGYQPLAPWVNLIVSWSHYSGHV